MVATLILSPWGNTTIVQAAVSVSDVTLSDDQLDLTVCDSKTLTARVAPNNATNQNISWTSSNEAVATVEDGVVRGIAKGTAIIVASAMDGSNRGDSCVVKVSEPTTSNISLYDTKTVSITTNGGYAWYSFTPTETMHYVIRSDGDYDTYLEVYDGLNSNNYVIYKDEGGSGHNFKLVYEFEAGKTYYFKARMYSTNVTGDFTISIIKAVQASNITIAPANVTIEQGKKSVVSAQFTPEDVDDSTVTWTSSNESIVTVDESGVVSAHAIGNAIIYATANDGSGVVGSCQVSVLTPTATEIVENKQEQIEITDSSDCKWYSFTPSETGFYSFTSSGGSKTNLTLYEDSTGNLIGTDNGYGRLVSKLTMGVKYRYSIQCTDNGIGTYSISLTKAIGATDIQLSMSELQLTIGQALYMNATVSPDSVTETKLDWSSSDPEVASVDANGYVTALKKGSSMITVRAVDGSGVYKETPVTVVKPTVFNEIHVGSTLAGTIAESDDLLWYIFTPSISGTYTFATQGELEPTIQLMSSTEQEDCITTGETSVTWDLEAGKTYYYQLSSSTATGTVTVAVTHIIDVTGVMLNHESKTLEVGSYCSLSVAVAPSNATNPNVTWSSSNLEIATVNQAGVVTTHGAGTAIITVTTEDGSYTAHCTITAVYHVKGVTLNQDSVTLMLGKSCTLLATVSPGNATNKTIKYQSSNSNVATVDHKGLVTTNGVGSAVITVTTEDGAYKAHCNVTVKESLSNLSISKISNKTHTGSIIKPSVTIKNGSRTLKQGTHYTVSYRNNKNVGTATVTIKGKGYYTGTVTKTFRIIAKKGSTYTVGNYKYKVTNASTSKGTVTLVGVTKKTVQSATIASKVKIGHYSYQVTAIGSKAFYHCSKLKKITIKSTKITSVGSNAFKGIYKKATITVPKSKYNAYKKLLAKKGQASTVKIKK